MKTIINHTNIIQHQDKGIKSLVWQPFAAGARDNYRFRKLT